MAVGNEVAVGEHRPFAYACGAAGVLVHDYLVGAALVPLELKLLPGREGRFKHHGIRQGVLRHHPLDVADCEVDQFAFEPKQFTNAGGDHNLDLRIG